VAATIHHTYSAYWTARRTRATRTVVRALRRFGTRQADRGPQGQTVSHKWNPAASLYKTARDDGTSSHGIATRDSVFTTEKSPKLSKILTEHHCSIKADFLSAVFGWSFITPVIIADRPSRIPRPVFTPRSPGHNTRLLETEGHRPRPILTLRSPGLHGRPTVQEEPADKRVAFQLLPWRLTTIDLDDRPLTRPPRYLLNTWDIRVRRYTSPTGPWSVPAALSPLPPSPTTSTAEGTQTQLPRVHRGIQAQPLCLDQSTQSDSDWETPCYDKGVQTTPPLANNKGVQTTSPLTDINNNCIGPLKYTRTRPVITYRERTLWTAETNGPFKDHCKYFV